MFNDAFIVLIMKRELRRTWE